MSARMVPRGNDSKSNYRELQIRGDHKHFAEAVTFIIDRSVEFREIQIYWKIPRARREQSRDSWTRAEKNSFENRKFRTKGWSQAFLDRVAVKSNSDSDRPAPNGAGRRWTWSETPLQKKKERKKRREGGQKRGCSPSCRKIRSENERTSLPAAISRDRIGPDQIKN